MSSPKKSNYESRVRKDGEAKMQMIEKAMHGKKAGKRESKNYRHKCSKGCNCD
jgi:hypothetical protein